MAKPDTKLFDEFCCGFGIEWVTHMFLRENGFDRANDNVIDLRTGTYELFEFLAQKLEHETDRKIDFDFDGWWGNPDGDCSALLFYNIRAPHASYKPPNNRIYFHASYEPKDLVWKTAEDMAKWLNGVWGRMMENVRRFEKEDQIVKESAEKTSLLEELHTEVSRLAQIIRDNS